MLYTGQRALPHARAPLQITPGRGGSQDFLCRQADMWSFTHSCLGSGSGGEEVIPKESDMTQAFLPNPMLTPQENCWGEK